MCVFEREREREKQTDRWTEGEFMESRAGELNDL